MDFSQNLQRWGIFRKLTLQCFLSDSKRVSKIRDKITSAIDERNLRANVQTDDAPGCTLNDLCVIVEHLIVHSDVATGLKSVHDAALLAMMWHTFGRAIDTCLARKHQLTLSASGELFKVFRYTSQRNIGNSACCIHLVCFISYDEPPEYLFPLVPRYTVSDTAGGQTYTQEEVVIYWGSLQNEVETDWQPIPK
ncbi:hypothetical protein PHMEG_00029378 [Phytophthora megakarya]|uniref:Uncharacterized protein n=1 Tax=Phytophthora megakarya TaxID=4795 RepID=A0A225V4C9_9STRA|nr:hypothetical protein PHMEG_00029378 [Phytophthora megakarya]